MMNFKKDKGNSNRQEPVLDMRRLAAEIDDEVESSNKRPGPEEYAPRSLRNQLGQQSNLPVTQIMSFGELPTKELDEIVAAAEAEIARLKADAQAVRDLYTKHTSRIAADIKRLQEGVRLSMKTMEALRAQCIQLDQPPSLQPEAEPEER